MKKLRDYQIHCVNEAISIIARYGIVYLALEVRTGKTAISLEIARVLNAKKVIFTTKKKAIDGIYKDYKDFNFDKHFEIVVINNESLHKIHDKDFDLLISDEHHRAGAYPKPTKTARTLRDRFGHLPIVCLSGTPHPESYSQLYHQFWVMKGFWSYTTFYKWFKVHGQPKRRHLGYAEVNVYDELNEKGIAVVNRLKKELFVTLTQRQAGFKTSVNKHIINYNSDDYLIQLCRKLMMDKFITIEGEQIIADTAVKLQNKIHQIQNGSVITESGETLILSLNKAEFIKERFKGLKLAIFYYFKAEYDILKEVFKDELTDDLDEFNATSKSIALQQVSGSEGISLRKADVLVYYNFGFSNVKFTQGIDRLTTQDRAENNVYFIFDKKSINEKAYNTLVYKKRSYISSAFKKDFNI